MLVKTIKPLSKTILLLLPFVITGCNSGGGGSSAGSSQGTMVLSNATSTTDVVLNGTHQYTVSYVNVSTFILQS